MKPVDVTYKNFTPSDAITDHVKQKAERLERLTDDIISTEVALVSPGLHPHHGQNFEVHLNVKVPGKTLVVNRDPEDDKSHHDIYIAIRDAFAAMERQIKSYSEKQQDSRKKQAKAKQEMSRA